MDDSISFLMTGVVFGLTAGVSPGPLLALVMSETLRHGVRGGIKVALAPLLTDLPIILITVLVLSRLSRVEPVLGLLSLAGAVFIGYLAFESLTVGSVEVDIRSVESQSLKKGVLTNFLNPHPYLFWFAVGTPTLFKAARVELSAAILFVAGFYVLIVGSKIAVAVAVGRFRFFLHSAVYLNTVRLLGVVLIVFAAMFLREGLKYLHLL